MQSSFWTQKGRARLTRVPDGIGVFLTCEGPRDFQFCTSPQRTLSPLSGASAVVLLPRALSLPSILRTVT